MDYERRLKAAAKIILDADVAATESPVEAASIGVTATLKPHQVEGLSWLIRRYLLGVNVVLGDEMGLGKTLQAIAFLSYLKVHQRSPGPFLVLCPLSVTDGWVAEIGGFAPNLRVLRYVGDKEHRRGLRRQMFERVMKQSSTAQVSLLPFDVLLATYDVALMDQHFLSQIPWQYAVIDEAQRLKNPSSVLYEVLKDSYIMPRRLLMTGTPVQNNLKELWSLMHFCMPSVFGTFEQFLQAFKEVGDIVSGSDAVKAKDQFKTLKSVLKAFMLRRTKMKLIQSGNLVLPALTEVIVMAPLVSLQKQIYTSILRKELSKLLALSSASSSHQSLQNIVIQLRKACSHPYLFPGIEPEPYEEGEHLVQASGKLMILDKLLEKLRDAGHRVLLFAQMTHTLDILQDFLELRKYSYERLDGSVRAEERFAAIRSFSGNLGRLDGQSDNNGAFVFMISTRAGGVGLNLVAADTVIFYEQDWNPQADRQALQRAHRIGQLNHVLAVNLVTRRTLEEVIMRRAERKLQLSRNVIGDGELEEEGKEAGVEIDDLHSIIFGLHKLDPVELANESSDELEMSELISVAERVIAMRHNQRFGEDDRKIELDSGDRQNQGDIAGRSSLTIYDPGLDEAAYLSWVEKFKEASVSSDNSILDMGRRSQPDDRHVKQESARKKAEEKKLAKWESLGYHSLTVIDPSYQVNNDILSNAGSINFVLGDCTQPEKFCPSEPCIIFSCVDDSGNWGRGGVFDALSRLSSRIPDAYQRAFEFSDLHLGDVHLIRTKGDGDRVTGVETPQWVALAVVQSYNARRKVPRSNISVSDLEQCVSKVSFAAHENSASVHMPRIGYQNSSDRSLWYAMERILRKYASIYGIKIYVYYFQRQSETHGVTSVSSPPQLLSGAGSH